MSTVKYYNGARIDSLAQKVLVTLADNEDMRNAEIAHKLGRKDDQDIIYYRLDEHLIPAGLVTRDETQVRDDTVPVYSLTTSGVMWVEDERDELERPKDLDEVSELVLEAQRESESAKNSVQSYRKDLWQQGNEIDELEEKLDKIRNKGAGGVTHKDMVDFVDMRSTQVQQDIDARASRLDAQIDVLDDDLTELESIISSVRQHAQENDEDVDQFWKGLEKADDAFDHLKDRMDSVEDDLETLRAEQVDQAEDNASTFFSL